MKLLDLQFESSPEGIRLTGRFSDEQKSEVAIDSYLRSKGGICRYLVVMVPHGSSRTIDKALQSTTKSGAMKTAGKYSKGESFASSQMGATEPLRCYVIDRKTKRMSRSRHNSAISEDCCLLTTEQRIQEKEFTTMNATKLSVTDLRDLILKTYDDEKAKHERRKTLDNLARVVEGEVKDYFRIDTGKKVNESGPGMERIALLSGFQDLTMPDGSLGRWDDAIRVIGTAFGYVPVDLPIPQAKSLEEYTAWLGGVANTRPYTQADIDSAAQANADLMASIDAQIAAENEKFDAEVAANPWTEPKRSPLADSVIEFVQGHPSFVLDDEFQEGQSTVLGFETTDITAVDSMRASLRQKFPSVQASSSDAGGGVFYFDVVLPGNAQ